MLKNVREQTDIKYANFIQLPIFLQRKLEINIKQLMIDYDGVSHKHN